MRRTTDAPKRRTSRCVPDQPGAMPSPDFRQAQLDPAFGDADVADRGELEPAAKGVAGERDNQRNAQSRQRLEGAMSGARPVAPHFERRQAAPGGDVAAGAKRLALAGEDGDARLAEASIARARVVAARRSSTGRAR